ncbi:hypothetical protein H2204_003089 [Knufia peltigerae]|uniref:BZIP domain-containing protein n=1 Tax=Knufia peltigerae TaxID=1002370 RepID=A0AA38Y9Y2_9EURO|nr:hypothetical protein H2204_003089 [Knufia peltigerae]
MTHGNSSRSKKRSSAAVVREDGQSQDEAIKRRRNRLSQRSFRERRLAYINELEEKSRRASQTESERNKALSDENVELRNSYLKLRKKVLGVICTLQEISEEAGKRLNLNTNQTATESADFEFSINESQFLDMPEQDEGVFSRPCGAQTDTNKQSSTYSNNDIQPDSVDIMFTESSDDCSDPAAVCGGKSTEVPNSTIPPEGNASESFFDHTKATILPDTQTEAGCFATGDHIDPGVGNVSGPHIPPSEETHQNAGPRWQMHTYCYGPNSTPDIWKQSPLICQIPPASQLGNPLQRTITGSLFLEHVEMLETLVYQKFLQLEDPNSDDRASEVIGTAVTLFHDYAWEGTARFWGSSQARSILEAILAWRCMPNSATLAKLPLAWRPTPLQLYTPHSCIIDWFPHAGLRDALILNHNNSPILDELFWDCMDCWVVTVEDMSTVLADADPGKGFIGLWNIIEAMDSSRTSNNPDSPPVSPFSHWSTSTVPGAPPFFFSKTAAAHGDSNNGSDDPLHGLMGKSCEKQSSGWTPMPLDFILGRKDLARDLFYHLNMQDTVSNWRFDAYLFEKYPELKYPGYESLVANGKSFRRPARKVGPTKMNSRIISLYQRAILGNGVQLATLINQPANNFGR